jgi:hypothetical protein
VSSAQNVARMTLCKCGCKAIEHYDSYGPCLGVKESDGEIHECSCDQFDIAGPEIFISVDEIDKYIDDRRCGYAPSARDV